MADVVRRLGPSTLVWREGLAAWAQAEAVPEFARAAWPAPPGPPPVPGPALHARDAEPHTLNPLVLWPRCLAWSGRFSRSEFAVARLGFLALTVVVVALGVTLSTAAGEHKSQAASIVIGAFIAVWVVIGLVVTLGSTVRRLHDLGQSGWLAVIAVLPCVNVVFLVYLLAAQGREGAAPPVSGAMPVGVVVAVVAAVVLLLVVPVIGIVAAIAIPSLLRARVAANEASAIGNVRTVI